MTQFANLYFKHRYWLVSCETSTIVVVAMYSSPSVSAIRENLALWMNAVQSTVQHGVYGSPSHAVDGNRNNQLTGRSCTSTMVSDYPWWQVDLAGMYDIHDVTIVRRGDCAECGKDQDISNTYVIVNAT